MSPPAAAPDTFVHSYALVASSVLHDTLDTIRLHAGIGVKHESVGVVSDNDFIKHRVNVIALKQYKIINAQI